MTKTFCTGDVKPTKYMTVNRIIQNIVIILYGIRNKRMLRIVYTYLFLLLLQISVKSCDSRVTTMYNIMYTSPLVCYGKYF